MTHDYKRHGTTTLFAALSVLDGTVIGRCMTVKRLYFRGDAAFANPEIYEFPKAEGMGYAIRLPANSILQ
jgi:hypothetical protein